MWRIIARYYKFIWIPLGTQFPEANSFSNTSFLFDRIWLKFEWRLLSVDFFFVLLKFLFFPRVSSYRLTDRTHKGRRQAPTLSDPPLSNTPSFYPPGRSGVGTGNKWDKRFPKYTLYSNYLFCRFLFEFQERQKKRENEGGQGARK